MKLYTVNKGMLTNEQFLYQFSEILPELEWVESKNVEILNVPCAFDIEVSSFYQDGIKLPENKRAVMYIWQFGIWNYVTYGREWSEFIALLDVLSNLLQLSDKRRLIIYIHNYAYEFQFIRHRFYWDKVFLLEERKPLYAETGGFIFKCSYLLSGRKLETVGDELMKYKVRKQVGSLDYNKIRTPKTPLTKRELLYCENDIRVLLYYVQEKIEYHGSIVKIPLTKTGYVREYCRKQCFKRWARYHDIMEELVVSPGDYSQLKRGFQGGFTHANAHYVRKPLENIYSYDFASSYPAVMVLEKFPMSRAHFVDHEMDDEELEYMLRNYCCLFDIKMWNLIPIRHQDHPLSSSKCFEKGSVVEDNGRVVTADYVKTTVTEQDYYIYQYFYDWEEAEITNFRYYEKDYLPTPFVKAILSLYKDKTMLKKVAGKEIEYALAKEMLNSCYGMTVTDILREAYRYINGAELPELKEVDVEIEIDKYNSNKNRFLYYPWGVWVTAYARANLFSGIIELGDDYVYSDTDSVKFFNNEKHADYFTAYTQMIMDKIKRSAHYHNIPIDDYMPKRQIIGVWDYEGMYTTFKTLGAKRYLTYGQEEDKKTGERVWKYHLTLAGAEKVKGCEYLVETGSPFDKFDNKMVIPESHSGRQIHTYIDSPHEGWVIDYKGVPYYYQELSAIHMENSKYELGMQKFIDYLKQYVDIDE